MNYYHELLDSYSKLKRRSFKLSIREAEEAKKKSATPKKAEPTKEKTPKADRQEKAEADIEKANGAAKSAFDGILASPQNYVGGAPLKAEGLKKETIVTVTMYPNANTMPNTRDISTLKFDDSGWSRALISRGQIKAQDPHAKDSNWHRFVQLFTDSSEMSSEDDATDTDATDDNQANEKAQEELIKQQNQALLKDVMVDFGLQARNDDSEPQLLDSLDYFGGGENQKYSNGFSANLDRLMQTWINNTDISLAAKAEGADRIRNLVRLATDIKRSEGETLTGSQISGLRSLFSNLAVGSNGQLILNNLTAGSDAEALVFGLRESGDVATGFETMMKTLTDAKDTYNAVVRKSSETPEERTIADPSQVQIENEGNPGRTSAFRGAVDENLWAGAGMLGKIVSATTTGDFKDRQWGLENLRKFVDFAFSKMLPKEIADTFARGKDFEAGDAVDTLLNQQSANYRNAIIDRLHNQFGPDSKSKNFKSREEAEFFVDTLSTDEQKAFATALLLRMRTLKSVFGDTPPMLSVYAEKRWSNIFRRKIDNAFVFDPTDTGSLQNVKDHIQENLATHGDTAKDVDRFMVTKTVKDFMDDNILKEEDLPPSFFDKDGTVDSTKELTVAAVSLKMLNSIKSDVPRGSVAGATVCAYPKKLNDYKREGLFSDKEAGKKASRAIGSDDRQAIYDDLHTEGGVQRSTIKDMQTVYRTVYDDTETKDAKGNVVAPNPARVTAVLWKRMMGKVKDMKMRVGFALDLITQGGIAREPELNVTTYEDTGEADMQSDEDFRDELYAKIKSGAWEVFVGGRGRRDTWEEQFETENISEENRQMFILDKKTKMPIVCIRGRPNDGRTNIFIMSDYQEHRRDLLRTKKEKAEAKKAEEAGGGTENSGTLIRQFLSGQADLIKELLAN
tara:strand:- start:1319 stop:4036 length:2718 start_codon:yes stop_codon:yes gene_type:complete